MRMRPNVRKDSSIFEHDPPSLGFSPYFSLFPDFHNFDTEHFSFPFYALCISKYMHKGLIFFPIFGIIQE